MAKAKKVRGIKVFMSDAEASALARLLNYGLAYADRTALGLDDFTEELTSVAGWRSFDFAQKAASVKDEPEV